MSRSESTPSRDLFSARSTVMLGALLLVIAAASFGASYVHLGVAALPVALLFAIAKALVITLFFMELARERASMVLAFLAGVAMLAVLLSLVAADVVTRAPPPRPPPPVASE